MTRNEDSGPMKVVQVIAALLAAAAGVWMLRNLCERRPGYVGLRKLSGSISELREVAQIDRLTGCALREAAGETFSELLVLPDEELALRGGDRRGHVSKCHEFLLSTGDTYLPILG